MNERADRLLRALGDIGEDLIEKAAPVYLADSEAGGRVRKVAPAIYEPEVKITKKDLRIYWITRALVMAAVVALIVGAVVLLVQNWDKIAVSGGERPGTIVKYIDELPDISEAYGKTIEFSDASVRISSVTYDGTSLNTNFYLLYKGNDEFYSPALWINVEGVEHGDPNCAINPVIEADSYDYLIQSTIPVDLEPGKSYAVNIVYKGSGNLENDTQKYRFICPDIPAVTDATTTNDPSLTSAVEPLTEPDEADTFTYDRPAGSWFELEETLYRIDNTAPFDCVTFNDDGTCSIAMLGASLKGSYNYNPDTDKITFKWHGVPLTAHLKRDGKKKLQLTFDADKFLSLISLLSKVSNNSALKALSFLVDHYDDVMVGFELKK